MLEARLPWFEGPANVVASDSDSGIFPTARACWPLSKGVSSSGMVGVVTDMRVVQSGGL
jgi:hypothetical protein